MQESLRRIDLFQRAVDSVNAAGACLLGVQLGQVIEQRGNLDKLSAVGGGAKGGEAQHSLGRGLQRASLGLAQRDLMDACHERHGSNFSLLVKKLLLNVTVQLF